MARGGRILYSLDFNMSSVRRLGGLFDCGKRDRGDGFSRRANADSQVDDLPGLDVVDESVNEDIADVFTLRFCIVIDLGKEVEMLKFQ